MVKSIERARPTGPAPTMRTGSTVRSPLLKNLELDKARLWMYPGDKAAVLEVSMCWPWKLLKNLKRPITQKLERSLEHGHGNGRKNGRKKK